MIFGKKKNDEFEPVVGEVGDGDESLPQFQAVPEVQSKTFHEIKGKLDELDKPAVEKQPEDYIDGQIEKMREHFEEDRRRLEEMQVGIASAQKRITLLSYIKNDNKSQNALTVKLYWLINRIGVLKAMGDDLEDLEAELFGIVQTEMDKEQKK